MNDPSVERALEEYAQHRAALAPLNHVTHHHDCGCTTVAADQAIRALQQELAEAKAALQRVTDEKDCCVDLIRDYEEATEKGGDFAAAVTMKSMVGHAEELQQELAEAKAAAERWHSRAKLTASELAEAKASNVSTLSAERDFAFDVLAALREEHYPVEEFANDIVEGPVDWHIFIRHLTDALDRRREMEE